MARRSRSRPDPHRERWLVSYADFITLLFAFFTTMYAMSVTDAHKAQRLVQSIRASFGDAVIEPLDAPSGVLEETREAPAAASAVRQARDEERRLDVLGERTRELARRSPDPTGLRVRRSEEGLVISLADSSFFGSGGTRISTDAAATLKDVASLLAAIPNHVRIEGHTDNEPVSSRVYRSNWHLSVLRAVEVLREFEREGLAANRLSAAGFADQRPLVSNATVAGRQMNRRVDIVILQAHIPEGDA